MNQQLMAAYAARMAAESGLPVTEAEAEAEVVRVIGQVSRNLAANFRFGYFGEDDIVQQGFLYGLQALEATRDGRPVYDPGRPLENFLHVHIKNRLMNLKRKHLMRCEAPCRCCEPFDPPAEPCRRWRDWAARNASKQALMRPLDVSCVSDDGERNMSVASTVADDVASREILALIDRGLPSDVRADYLRMRAGVSVPKGRRQRVREAVLALVGPSALGVGDGR